MAKISRRQIASYVASALLEGKSEVVQQLAAYLVAERRTSEADMLVRDIEKSLEEHGTVVAHLESAHELDVSQRQAVESLLKNHFDASQVFVDTTIDKDLLGGVVVSTASNQLDASLRRNINRLKAIKL